MRIRHGLIQTLALGSGFLLCSCFGGSGGSGGAAGVGNAGVGEAGSGAGVGNAGVGEAGSGAGVGSSGVGAAGMGVAGTGVAGMGVAGTGDTCTTLPGLAQLRVSSANELGYNTTSISAAGPHVIEFQVDIERIAKAAVGPVEEQFGLGVVRGDGTAYCEGASRAPSQDDCSTLWFDCWIDVLANDGFAGYYFYPGEYRFWLRTNPSVAILPNGDHSVSGAASGTDEPSHYRLLGNGTLTIECGDVMPFVLTTFSFGHSLDQSCPNSQ
jgi:hypothetical protein